MTALNTQNYLKNSSEQDSIPRHKDSVNHSVQLGDGSQKHINRMNPMLKSVASAQNVTPRSAHDFTEIMGYKNIDISRDVDQSYMLKGSNNTNKKTNSSRNKSQ